MSDDPIIRCPMCGHKVPTYFHHIAIDCNCDMTDAEVRALEQQELDHGDMLDAAGV